MFDSVDALSAKLAAAGYFIDQLMAKVVFLAVELRKPILLEGPAGSGKTQLAVHWRRQRKHTWSVFSATQELQTNK